MFEKLVTGIMNTAKKHRWLVIPAIGCLFVAFSLYGMWEMAAAGGRRYGTPALMLLLCLLLTASVVASVGQGLPVPHRSLAVLSAVSHPQEEPEQIAKEDTEDWADDGAEEGTVPFDREHPKISVTPPNPVEESGDPKQDQLLQTIEKNVGRLKVNQVTPDWAPDLLSANSGLNKKYYQRAWSAYEVLTDVGRTRLDAETLDYLLTCHRTITGQ